MRNVIELLIGAKKASTLELSEFGRLHPSSYKDAVPFPTCENEVTAFIKERVELHHNSWITKPLEEALQLLKGFDHE